MGQEPVRIESRPNDSGLEVEVMTTAQAIARAEQILTGTETMEPGYVSDCCGRDEYQLATCDQCCGDPYTEQSARCTRCDCQGQIRLCVGCGDTFEEESERSWGER